jgi:hypothetical protein
LGREIGYLEGLRLLYQDFSKDYEAMGNFEEALKYEIHFKELNDSLFNDENTSKINALTTKWETDRHDKELLEMQRGLIEQQLSEKKSSQNLWLIGGGIFFLGIFSAYAFYVRTKLKENRLLIEAQQALLERQNKSSEKLP